MKDSTCVCYHPFNYLVELEKNVLKIFFLGGGMHMKLYFVARLNRWFCSTDF